MNRRDFCSSVAAATSLAGAGLALADAHLPKADGATIWARPYRLIYDRRFPAARLLGAAAAQGGLATNAFDGDVTALWFHDLGPRWALDRAPVAGITTPEALFCLEQLARDAWLRVTLRAEHAEVDARACSHRVSGRAGQVARACAALDAGADWPARMALALTQVSRTDGAHRVRRHIDAERSPPAAGPAVRLVSWVIAA